VTAALQENSAARTGGEAGYVLLIVCIIVSAFAYRLRTEGIFTCPADGYGTDSYLAYCQGSGYGEYDRGAFWYGLEPEVAGFAAQADVLFLGSSRMQLAFSTAATTNWFASSAARHYLLGFTHTENIVFATPLLSRLQPRPRVYVINVDGFFDDRLTPPAQEILRDPDTQGRYRAKRRWQVLHQRLCTAWPAACGHRLAFFRERTHGTWQLSGSAAFAATAVSDGPPGGRERWDERSALAAAFLSRLPVDRQCVVLTIAPSQDTNRAEAAAIAAALGLDLVSPQLDGLRTFDGSHLDSPSAERWSSAFFQAAGPRIRQCLDPSAASASQVAGNSGVGSPAP
jgi:hypothetical protein